jgi:hypothetical protein
MIIGYYRSWPAILFGDSSDSSSPIGFRHVFWVISWCSNWCFHVFSYRHISPFIWDESEFCWKNRTVSPSNGKVSARCSPLVGSGSPQLTGSRRSRHQTPKGQISAGRGFVVGVAHDFIYFHVKSIHETRDPRNLGTPLQCPPTKPLEMYHGM